MTRRIARCATRGVRSVGGRWRDEEDRGTVQPPHPLTPLLGKERGAWPPSPSQGEGRGEVRTCPSLQPSAKSHTYTKPGAQELSRPPTARAPHYATGHIAATAVRAAPTHLTPLPLSSERRGEPGLPLLPKERAGVRFERPGTRSTLRASSAPWRRPDRGQSPG